VHGERGEALAGEGGMEGKSDKVNKEETLDPIMMFEDHIK
jgi:hypothetical protein